MMRSVFSTAQRRGRGQALVEFTLTALVFLLMLVMVIEVGRILAAYVTLQHAARQAARYAITGQWETNYQASPVGHFVTASDNPYERVAPCWPLFDDDGYSPTLPGPSFYQPYRNARTCSIEDAALQAMTGLALDPTSGFDDPNYYQIVVSGFNNDIYPETGTFARLDGGGNPETPNYSTYFTLAAHSGQNSGLARGYGGGPNQKVVVQIEYRLPIITPLVSAIAPSLRLTSTAVMTNESFGSTSLQREAVLPPELPAITPLEPPVPPDLIIPTFTTTWNLATPITFTDDLEFTVEISNIGELNTVSPFDVRLYQTTDDVDPASVGATPPGGWVPVTNGQWLAQPNLVAGGSRTLPVVTNARLSTSGFVYVYAWVDSGTVIDEEGSGSVADPNRELNNVAKLGPFLVGDAVNLSLDATTPSPTPANGSTVTYTIDVANAAGLSSAVTTVVQFDLTAYGGNVTYAGSSIPCLLIGPQYECTFGGPIASPGSDTFTVNLAMGAGVDNSAIAITFRVDETSGLFETDDTDNSDFVTVYTGGTDIAVTKTVNDAAPNINDTIAYTLTATNNGLNAATNVVISDVLPAQVSFVSATGDGSYDDSLGEWTIGSVAAASSAAIDITVTVDAGGTVLNSATLSSMDQPDSDFTNDTSSVVFTTFSADLEVQKAVTGDFVEGGTIEYLITLTNLGPDTANTVSLVDTLPAGVTYVSDSPSNGATIESGGTVTWTLTSIPLGQIRTLTIEATVDAGTDGDTITNTTDAANADESDAVPANNSDSVAFTVDNRTDLGMSVVTTVNGTSGTTASVGDTVVFTWTISNNGPMDATDLSITLDDALALANWSSITVVDGAGNTLDLSSTLGDLAAGDSMDIIVTAIVGTLASDTIDTFAATVSAVTPSVLDDVPGGSTDPEDDSVTVTLLAGPRQFISENFDASRGCFNSFGDIGSAYVLHHATEVYPATGYSGNALAVSLGQGLPNSDTNMAGGWSCTFNVGSAVTDSRLSFYYRLVPTANYESNEHTDVLVELDGSLIVGTSVLTSSNSDTGWLQATINTGALSAGNHTLVIGGYNNVKTEAAENGIVYIDSVDLSESELLFSATFNTNTEGLVAVTQEAFEGLIGGGTHDTSGNSNASYAGGQGNPAGSLRVDLGEYLGVDTNPTNMSAGYEYTFTLSAARDVYVDFDYSMTMSNDYDGGEHSYVLLSVDDTTLIGPDVNNSVAHLEGGGSTGWVSSGGLYLGNLTAGTHTIMIGGYNNAATTLTEDTVILIDNLRLTAN